MTQQNSSQARGSAGVGPRPAPAPADPAPTAPTGQRLPRPSLPRGLAFHRAVASHWRTLAPLERFVAYSRWSIVSTLPMIGLMYCLPFLDPELRADIPAWVGVLALVCMGGLCALSGISVSRRSELHTRAHRDHRAFTRAALALGVVIWLGGIAGSRVVGADAGPVLAMLGFFAFLTLAVSWLPWQRWRWIIVFVAAALTLTLTLSVLGTAAYVWTFMAPFLLGMMVLGLWSVGLAREADTARQLQGQLAISEERLRIAQELHDTMGQHLAAMSLKSQVALARVRRGDPRAEAELEELQRLTKSSASEMREVVHAFRSINLATEIAGARGLLEDAGVSVRTVGDSLSVPEQHRELAAWFVREGATNILRHAHATKADFHFASSHVVISNDGAIEPPRQLSGLGTLQRRSPGATVSIEHKAPMFTATLLLPKDPA